MLAHAESRNFCSHGSLLSALNLTLCGLIALDKKVFLVAHSEDSFANVGFLSDIGYSEVQIPGPHSRIR